jgi:hypothetical protein
MAGGAIANPVPPGLYELSRECPVWVGKGFQKFVVYGTESAKKHSGSDPETLRKELQKALNAPPNKQIAQGDGVFKVYINEGNGYVVFKLNDPGPLCAKIFHYHWHYELDNPL